ncbi:helix-turn-helix domain-containing protein [Flexithrix dorotheae]|uniref:helix-turn-helix domain-containing protein n=1 Tax=Flexithrix dorotheae TaxID=70993 RepID=UPI000378D243|nr:helix-turn-helix domain-containing protein [Flexithrix dorotheae]
MLNLENLLKNQGDKVGWNLKKIALKSGIPYTTLLHNVKQNDISIQKLEKIATALNVTLEELIFQKEKSEIEKSKESEYNDLIKKYVKSLEREKELESELKKYKKEYQVEQGSPEDTINILKKASDMQEKELLILRKEIQLQREELISLRAKVKAYEGR